MGGGGAEESWRSSQKTVWLWTEQPKENIVAQGELELGICTVVSTLNSKTYRYKLTILSVYQNVG